MEPEEEVLRRITPSPGEDRRIAEAVTSLTAAILRRAQELGINIEPMVVGSVAKGTHLPNPDVDLFVCFPPGTPREELKDKGLALGKLLEGGRTMYAEHPYTRGTYGGIDVEIVPCYRLAAATDRMSAVDRTPFHTAYVRARLSEPLRAGIRLLKQFTKGVGVYGAEARVQGFSGYLCELLVLHHGGFRETLRGAHQWRPGAIITLDAQPSRSFPEPLVVVDPVDPGRNVASAVSIDQMATFVLAASEYLAGPSMLFFFPPPPRSWPLTKVRRELRDRGLEALEFSFAPPPVTDDVLFPQLWKCRTSIVDLLHRHGFRVKDTALRHDPKEVALVILLEVATLPAVKSHQGPPPWVKNAQDFLDKWGKGQAVAGPYVRGEHIMVDIPREHRHAADLVRAEVPTLSLGKDVDGAVAAGFRVATGAAVARAENRGVLTELLEKTLPWRRAPSPRDHQGKAEGARGPGLGVRGRDGDPDGLVGHEVGQG